MINKKNLILAALCAAVALFSVACKVDSDDDFAGDIAGAHISGGHSAPKNFEAEAATSYSDRGKIEFTWDAVDGADSYNIYHSETLKGPYTGGWSATATSTSWITPSALTSNKTYYFMITAVFSDGTESPFSASVSAIPQ
ncbi:MAG: hypothetical protein LBT33_03145 [Spirochaetia bacterium]|jgi:hypothetical protein|nr:hypothetical protein [Spirochaetia bacterium]